ncbi:unnamed protein product [Discula destructiva]
MDTGTLTASVASSIVSRVICYPLDTIAIQHTSSTRRPLLSVPLRSYYRGLPVSVAIVTPAFALYLCTYRQAKASLQPYLGDTTVNYAAAGAVAELVSSLLWTPCEVIKARLQISTTARDGALLHNLREIARTEGIRGFYRGYFLGLAIFIPYNAIWWGVYENTKKTTLVRDRLPTPVQAAVCSTAAVVASSGLLHPLELVKTRYQVATSGTVGALAAGAGSGGGGEVAGRVSDRRGMRQIVGNVLREAKGSFWRGFYRGYGPRLACSIPSSLIMMTVFEHLKPDVTEDVLELEI